MGKKKVGIITLNGNYNYGNRLQNYALEYYLKKMDVLVDTIWIISFKEYLKKKIKEFIVLHILKSHERSKNFLKFSNKNINIKYYINSKKIDKKYDYFICGSDQVWNYSFDDFNDEIMFLKFSLTKEKNISYSASFGVSNIKEEFKGRYIKGLNNFNHISVREETGRKIVKSLLPNKDVSVLIDPTMLLTSNEWDKVMKKPDNLKNDKYILTYFLGEMTSSIKEEINSYAKKNNCQVINILDKNSPFFNSGPSEFLYLEKNAFLICTDSFHSSVFAIIYNRPFVVFDRNDNKIKMNSRIDTLLKKFGLSNRKYEGKINNDVLICDYSQANMILEEERLKSKNFLKKALKIENLEVGDKVGK